MARLPHRATFRFYAGLNEHLPAEAQQQPLEREFFVPGSAKDMIESFGVPHTEVALIVINGAVADFARLVEDGDRVAVYPEFERLDTGSRAPREPAFVLDVHLGRLTAYLRMLGFDVHYRNCLSDPELVRISVDQGRILLTRDRGLLKHSALKDGYWLRETDSRRQAAEVVRRFDLTSRLNPFTRCMACNDLLRSAAKSTLGTRVPAGVLAKFDEFRECPRCRRVYWQGSHYDRMRRLIEELAAT